MATPLSTADATGSTSTTTTTTTNPITNTASTVPTALPHSNERITLIGLGAIGISFLALHLTYTSAVVSVYDPRPDLAEHIAAVLPLYLPSPASESESDNPSKHVVEQAKSSGRLRISTNLDDALHGATIVQEQGPENVQFKQDIWRQVIRKVSRECHLWSSTSGIEASRQLADAETNTTTTTTTITTHEEQDLLTSARTRLLVVHPFNPPHIMPLIELVPSPHTSPSETTFAQSYFTRLSSGHRPIIVHKEIKGFVANRLSFILLREACHLVNEGVVSVDECDEIIRASLGPRWAVKGVFEMYGFGGGNRGLDGFFDNIGQSVDEVWRDAGGLHMEGHGHGQGKGERGGEGKSEAETESGAGWREKVVRQANHAFGLPTAQGIRNRDRGLKMVVNVQEEMERLETHEREEEGEGGKKGV